MPDPVEEVQEIVELGGSVTPEESDSSLDALMAEHGEEIEPEVTKAEDETKPEAAEEVEDTDDDDEPDEDYLTAYAALKRYGHPDLDEFAKTDGFIEFGLKQAQIQKDLDEKAEKHKATANRLAEFERTVGNPSDTSTPAADDQQIDVSEFVEPLAKHFKEVYGEDESKPLTTAFTGLIGKMQESFDQRAGQSNAQVEQLQGVIASMQAESARKELLSEYPQLKSKDSWEAVQKRMLKIGISEDQPDILSLANYCCEVQFAKDILKQAKAAKKEAAATKKAANLQRDKGLPSAPATATEKVAEDTRASLSDQLLDAEMAQNEPLAAEIRGKLNRFTG